MHTTYYTVNNTVYTTTGSRAAACSGRVWQYNTRQGKTQNGVIKQTIGQELTKQTTEQEVIKDTF